MCKGITFSTKLKQSLYSWWKYLEKIKRARSTIYFIFLLFLCWYNPYCLCFSLYLCHVPCLIWFPIIPMIIPTIWQRLNFEIGAHYKQHYETGETLKATVIAFGHCCYHANYNYRYCCFFFKDLQIQKLISHRFPKPILGMFVLIWMHLSWWFHNVIMTFILLKECCKIVDLSCAQGYIQLNLLPMKINHLIAFWFSIF